MYQLTIKYYHNHAAQWHMTVRVYALVSHNLGWTCSRVLESLICQLTSAGLRFHLRSLIFWLAKPSPILLSQWRWRHRWKPHNVSWSLALRQVYYCFYFNHLSVANWKSPTNTSLRDKNTTLLWETVVPHDKGQIKVKIKKWGHHCNLTQTFN